MKALVVPNAQAQTLDQLVWTEQPLPVIAPDQVLVRTIAVGLNPVDEKLISHPHPEWHYPHTLGLDVAGVVTQVGTAVTQFQPGQRVCGHGNLAVNGAFAEAVAMPATALAVIPAGVSFEKAAGCLCAGLTAYQALYRKANLANVETVLIHAGAGGVGSMAIQLAQAAGKRVFTTVSKAKQGFVARLAPAAQIDYRNENVDARIQALTAGHGVDLIINTIGHAEADLPRLAYNGQLVCVLAAPTHVPTDRALSVNQLNLGGAHRSGDPRQVADLGRMAKALLALVAAQTVDPLITQVLTRSQLVAGLKQIQADQVVGKLVCRIADRPQR